jgi:hypothetical protein
MLHLLDTLFLWNLRIFEFEDLRICTIGGSAGFVDLRDFGICGIWGSAGI